jgi:hypothetical protein
MNEALRLFGEEKALEIGTGSGCQTALLAVGGRMVIPGWGRAEPSFAAHHTRWRRLPSGGAWGLPLGHIVGKIWMA